MFAEIGRFLQKNVVEPIDRAVIRPIDQAIVQPIREATDKDYALRRERKQVETLERKNSELRPKFFQAQQDLAAAQAEYERISEDFSEAHGAPRLRALVRSGPGDPVRINPRAGTPEVLRVIEDGSRSLLKTVSFGLTEAIFNKDEIPRERAYLNKRIAELDAESRQLTAAIAELRGAEDRYRTATAEIGAEHAKLGSDATASDIHIISARAKAQRDIIERLMRNDVPQSGIAEITGIPPEMIAEVARNSASGKGL
jgi:hypothetical protein